jgi:hypothetical protein
MVGSLCRPGLPPPWAGPMVAEHDRGADGVT